MIHLSGKGIDPCPKRRKDNQSPKREGAISLAVGGFSRGRTGGEGLVAE